uniref:Uncharacterized protein n=1 Tax=Escherichia coli TaxID=562 RepID=A0A385EN60_ECOLX|nr:hypothetical protein pECSIC9_00069 [Escherichia coli]
MLCARSGRYRKQSFAGFGKTPIFPNRTRPRAVVALITTCSGFLRCCRYYIQRVRGNPQANTRAERAGFSAAPLPLYIQ